MPIAVQRFGYNGPKKAGSAASNHQSGQGRTGKSPMVSDRPLVIVVGLGSLNDDGQRFSWRGATRTVREDRAAELSLRRSEANSIVAS
jgi:hypothetical protein